MTQEAVAFGGSGRHGKGIVWLLGLTFLGVGGGWLIMASASYPISEKLMGNPFSLATRQLLFIAGGAFAFVIGMFFPLPWLRRWGWFFHLFVVVLLGLTLAFGRGVGGAQRWLSLGPFHVQPSELAKVSLIVAIASLADHWRQADGWRKKASLWGVILVFWLATVGLVLWQPHLSGAVILFFIGVVTLFFSALSLPLIVATVLLTCGIGIGLKPYAMRQYHAQRWRFASHPGQPLDRLHYQQRQALLALGAGGIWGNGWLKGRQKHLFLPAAHNDFIFAVIGEELGFLGTFSVLVFFLALAYWGLWAAARAPDPFMTALAGGGTCSLWGQAMLHVAVNLSLLPPTGIPLPFVSAGGSSLWGTLLMMALVVNVARHADKKHPDEGREARGLGPRRGWDRRTPLSRPRPRRYP